MDAKMEQQIKQEFGYSDIEFVNAKTIGNDVYFQLDITGTEWTVTLTKTGKVKKNSLRKMHY